MVWCLCHGAVVTQRACTAAPAPPPPPLPNACAHGIQCIKDAIAADNAGHVNHAIALYEQGIQLLQTHAATETNPKFHMALAAKVDQYRARVQELRQHNPSSAAPAVVTRAAHARTDSGEVAPRPPVDVPLRSHGTGGSQRSIHSRSGSVNLSQQDWRELAIGMTYRC